MADFLHRRIRIILMVSMLMVGYCDTQAQEVRRFYPDIFTLFNPVAVGNPSGAENISNGLIQFGEFESLYTANASTIFTLRPDSLVCVVTSAGVVNYVTHNLLNNVSIPPDGFDIPFNIGILMGFMGRDSIGQDGNHYSVPEQVWSNRLSSAKLVARELDSEHGINIALLLIPRYLLSPYLYEIGFDLDDSANTGSYFIIHHTEDNPQCLSDSIQIDDVDENHVLVNTNLPYAFTDESVGAPLIRKATVESPFPTLRGVYSGNTDEGEEYGDMEQIYFREGKSTKIRKIENAILRHCLKDSLAIKDRRYKEGRRVFSNSVQRYLRNFIFNSVTSFASHASVIHNMTYGFRRSSRLDGSTRAGGNFLLPAKFPGTTEDWEITWVGAELMLTDGFSYDAAGNSGLYIVSKSLDAGSAASAISNPIRIDILNNDNNPKEEDFLVYPNPSGKGDYNVVIRNTGRAHTAQVHSAVGLLIHEGEMAPGDNIYKLSLSSVAKGNYYLSIYDKESGERLFSKVLVYH